MKYLLRTKRHKVPVVYFDSFSKVQERYTDKMEIYNTETENVEDIPTGYNGGETSELSGSVPETADKELPSTTRDYTE